MKEYAYYALFLVKDNKIIITFPDLDDCLTCGDNLIDALDMAEDLLREQLNNLRLNGSTFPKANLGNSFNIPKGADLINIKVSIN